MVLLEEFRLAVGEFAVAGVVGGQPGEAHEPGSYRPYARSAGSSDSSRKSAKTSRGPSSAYRARIGSRNACTAGVGIVRPRVRW